MGGENPSPDPTGGRSRAAGTRSGGEAALEDLRASALATAEERGEPEWLSRMRVEAVERYASQPLPDRVTHLWRYSEPQEFTPRAALLREAAGGPPSFEGWPPEIEALLGSGELSGAALVAGGSLIETSLDPDLAAKGVLLVDLHRASREHSDRVRGLLGTLVPAGAGKFEALNAALWRGGVLLHVPRGVEVPKPIHIWNAVGPGIVASRLVVSAEEASDLMVIDEYAGGAARPAQVYSVVEDFAGPSARLRHLTVQRLGMNAILHLSQRAQVARDGKALSVIASLGGSLAKADLGTILGGQGAEVELLGFLFGEGRQHFDHHTVHDHRAGNTHSDLDFKVVLKDRSLSAYTGLIRITPDAPKSEAYQENRNLLLNDGARAESIPELEILTDEVMCTHGATVGTLDPEHLFYLGSRGIPRPEAKRMIVGGFIEPTLNRLPADLKERLRAHVDRELESI